MTSSNPTCSSVSNTTTESNLIAATIPANSLADGDYLDLSGQVDYVNNSGASISIAQHVAFGALSALLGSSGFGTGVSRSQFSGLTLMRQGSHLWATIHAEQGVQYGVPNPFSAAPANNSSAIDLGAPDFTVDNTLAITITFSAANASISATANSAKLIQY